MFIINFRNFLKFFQQFAVFLQRLTKVMHGLLNFLKNMKKAFLAIFLRNISKISENFRNNCAFRPNERKISAWIVTCFEKYAKIMHL